MLTVHHLGISQSDRIVWLCEELGLDYELVRYERDPISSVAPPEYKALHPYGTAPIITDGDLALGESGAIVEYIIAKYGNGRLALTASHPGFTDYLYWFHFANGSMMPNALADLIISLVGGQPNDTSRSISERGNIAYHMVEQRLTEGPYFAGDAFTAADIMMVFPLTTMRTAVPRDITPYSGIRNYLQRIGKRPAFQRAMAKADPGFTPPLS